jgi:hypothetical protein
MKIDRQAKIAIAINVMFFLAIAAILLVVQSGESVSDAGKSVIVDKPVGTIEERGCPESEWCEENPELCARVIEVSAVELGVAMLMNPYAGSIISQDYDSDGVDDQLDNCPSVPNPGQENTDKEFDDDIWMKNGSQLGDVCDPDRDSTHRVEVTFRPAYQP